MLKLNADCGESYGAWSMGQDELLLSLVDQANIACGGHASDPVVMRRTVKLAIQHGCEIGAHVGYPDKEGFGRRSLKMTANEIEQMCLAQIGALQMMCQAEGDKVHFLKPHGAFYHDMLKDYQVVSGLVNALLVMRSAGHVIELVIPFQMDISELQSALDANELSYRVEGFLDRGYQEDGSLVPRGSAHATLEPEQILERFENLKAAQKVAASSGALLSIEADTWCLHGDHPNISETLSLLSKHND